MIILWMSVQKLESSVSDSSYWRGAACLHTVSPVYMAVNQTLHNLSLWCLSKPVAAFTNAKLPLSTNRRGADAHRVQYIWSFRHFYKSNLGSLGIIIFLCSKNCFCHPTLLIYKMAIMTLTHLTGMLWGNDHQCSENTIKKANCFLNVTQCIQQKAVYRGINVS